ncbi:uncharacterized protein (DUF427 family) [Kitasatospora sp. MAA4]|uniref:DUF427 domain-containing protein n=1 Tax=Kitasatospora sp. MAA4 TaxID=3035093 RepID=UPI002473F269|nr:DUF427 domain-containing protein [Kitasatospora sp. MAA4]MDH6135438.1 uncharacterized protein (DUF427 family) [Kitasatospora sp. MAA4]
MSSIPNSPQHVENPVRLEQGRGRVTVWSGDTLLANSHRVVVVHEGRHPVRYYLPPEDVRTDLLGVAQTDSYCPYKGAAVHHALVADGPLADAVAWSYPTPLPGMEPLAGLIAFYQERTRLVAEDF